jgi:hypothetical protein
MTDDLAGGAAGDGDDLGTAVTTAALAAAPSR